MHPKNGKLLEYNYTKFQKMCIEQHIQYNRPESMAHMRRAMSLPKPMNCEK